MAEPFKSVPARALLRLALAIYGHRRWFFYPQAALFLLCLLYTVQHLEFRTDRSALVGAEKEYHRLFLEFRREFPAEDDLVVVVESEDAERNRQFVERLGARLEAETNLFAGVLYKHDLARLGPKALLFLDEDSLDGLHRTLQANLPMLRRLERATNLVALVNLLNAQFRTAQRQANADNEALQKALPALARILRLAADGLERPGSPPTPGVTALFEGGPAEEQQQYLSFAGGRMFLVTAQARSARVAEEAVARLRHLIEQTKTEVPGLNVGLTGEPILEMDEMVQSQKDTALASALALLGVALIFIYGYHETGRPLKATACLVVGLVYTLGFTTLVVGHLNILTITFVPILLGLAIDFGVHLITRYEEELRHGRSEKVALEKAMVNTGMGIFTGALTTAVAFLAMTATGFKGIQEMGLICGGGMLICLAPMLTLLPVLLLRGQQNVLDHELGPLLEARARAEFARRARVENLWLGRPMAVIALCTGLTVAALLGARRVRFDYNLLHMQSAGLTAVETQARLIQAAGRSVLYAAVVAATPEDAVRLETLLTNLPAVRAVESLGPWLAGEPAGKLHRVRAIKALAEQVRFGPADPGPVCVPALMQGLWSLHGYLDAAAREVRTNDASLFGQLRALQAAISRLQTRLRVGNRPEAARKLGEYQRALLDDVRRTFEVLQSQDDRDRLRPGDLPETLRRRFVGVTGKLLLQVYPKEDIWEHAAQLEFIRQLRQVDPKVTGSPVQLLEYTTLLKASYEEAALYSLVAIALMVGLHFRRLSCVLLALLPVGAGGLWLTGLMGAVNLPFNPANIMTLPLVVGIGVTNGIHILNRFAEESHPSILARSTGKAVLVSGLTTIVGFGSLLVAAHRGIRSLGLIMALGVGACMIVGLTLVPAILNLLHGRGWTLRKKK